MGPWTRLWDEVWDEWSLTADINDMTLVLNRLRHKSVLLKLHVLHERMTGYTICSPWVHRVLTWATWTVKSVVYMKSLMYSQAAGKQKQPVHLWLTVSSQPVSLWWKIRKYGLVPTNMSLLPSDPFQIFHHRDTSWLLTVSHWWTGCFCFLAAWLYIKLSIYTTDFTVPVPRSTLCALRVPRLCTQSSLHVKNEALEEPARDQVDWK